MCALCSHRHAVEFIQSAIGAGLQVLTTRGSLLKTLSFTAEVTHKVRAYNGCKCSIYIIEPSSAEWVSMPASSTSSPPPLCGAKVASVPGLPRLPFYVRILLCMGGQLGKRGRPGTEARAKAIV